MLQGMNAGSFYKGLKYAAVHGGKPLSFHKGSTIYISITYHGSESSKGKLKMFEIKYRWHLLFVHHEARANCKIFFKVRHIYCTRHGRSGLKSSNSPTRRAPTKCKWGDDIYKWLLKKYKWVTGVSHPTNYRTRKMVFIHLCGWLMFVVSM